MTQERMWWTYNVRTKKQHTIKYKQHTHKQTTHTQINKQMLAERMSQGLLSCVHHKNIDNANNRKVGDATRKKDCGYWNNTYFKTTQTTQMSVALILRGVIRRCFKEDCGPRAFRKGWNAPPVCSSFPLDVPYFIGPENCCRLLLEFYY